MPRRWTPTVLALLITLLLVPVAFADDEPGDEPAVTPAVSADDDEIARTKELVAKLRAITAEIRGLEWKQPVEAGLLTRAQTRQRMLESIKEELPPEELEAITRILRRVKMLGPDENPLTIFMDMITGTAGGFFDPDDKKLFIIAGQDPESLTPVIIHELLHALEDQYIDLKTTQEAMEDDPDRMFAFKCMIEGSAEIARVIFEERFPEESKKYNDGQRGNAELQAGQQRAMARTPAYMMVDTMLHYRTGPDFVGKALGDTPYVEGMDALYENQPVSQEQVLHPEKWLGDKQDWPRTVVWGGDLQAAAGEAWTTLDEMSQGELDLALWIDFHLGNNEGRLTQFDMARGTFVAKEAHQAAEGWDAGRVLYLDKDGEHIGIVAAFAFDTRRDAHEAFEALVATMKKTHGADFEETARQDATEDDDRAAIDYKTPLGMSRILRRGEELLLVDGLPSDTFEAVWPSVAATSFVRDVRDTWDPATAVDPFSACSIVDRERLIGVPLPAEWHENERLVEGMRQGNPAFVTAVQRGTVMLQIITVDQGSTQSRLPSLVRAFLGPAGAQVDLSRVFDARVMGREDGLRFELSPDSEPGVRRLYAATDGQRTTLVVLRGAREHVTQFQSEIDTIVGGIKSLLSY